MLQWVENESQFVIYLIYVFRPTFAMLLLDWKSMWQLSKTYVGFRSHQNY